LDDPAGGARTEPETGEHTTEAHGRSWTFEAHGDLTEPPCPDDLPDDESEPPDPCDPTARLRLVATAPNGEERQVYTVENEDATFDSVWAELSPIEGSADPQVQMLQLIMEFGADFHSVTSQTYLVRLDPSVPSVEILFEGSGESQSEMDSCLSYDIIAFIPKDDGKVISAVREREVLFTEQDGLDVECDPEPYERELLEEFRITE
jgi:hypothetical protein